MTEAATARAEPLEEPAPFDALAADYDATFGLSPSGRLFRFRLAERIEAAMKPGASLLDIGSGTGEDAVWLSAKGFRVTGIDPSPAMAAIASGKAGTARGGPLFEVSGLRDFKPPAAFDAVYSNFGAMNCVEPRELGPALSRLLVPGGRAFLVLMGSRPLPLLFREGLAGWRRRVPSRLPVGRAFVDISYPGPGALSRALGGQFRIERTETLGALVPPATASDWPRRHPILFALIAAVERLISRRRVLASFSDHFLIELSRP